MPDWFISCVKGLLTIVLWRRNYHPDEGKVLELYTAIYAGQSALLVTRTKNIEFGMDRGM